MITIWVPKRLVEVDLYNVAARSPQALAQLSENSYARRVQYAAQKVRGSGAKIVMLTGPSASGKTTSAHCLAKALVQQGTPAQVVSLDNFFKGAAYYPKMPDGTLDYENLETLDLPLIKQCLHQLSETGKTELPIYDFATEQRAAAVEPIDLQGGVCIVEGIHALNPELTGLVPDDQIYRIYAGLREVDLADVVSVGEPDGREHLLLDLFGRHFGFAIKRVRATFEELVHLDDVVSLGEIRCGEPDVS